MTADELRKVIDAWGLNAAQAAKILCLHSSKLSEYLGGVERIPCSLSFTLEVLAMLEPQQRRVLFERRLAREAHSG